VKPWTVSVLSLALVSTGCCWRSTSPQPAVPLPPVLVRPTPARLDCRPFLARVPAETLDRLRALPRCVGPAGQPMSSADLCWTAAEANLAGTVLARYVLADADLAACLDGGS
jgi:hypothetical protein